METVSKGTERGRETEERIRECIKGRGDKKRRNIQSGKKKKALNRRMPSSGILRRVALVRTDVS
jgi:hypothetical protein